ncbi:hypothetical protein RJ640_021477 [Escallonia rubra]|uniref:Glycosyl hydrolase family 38 C-terminal domain-containing protein n=1 Tax=Escallonia rubra TaxID=112253 RepID=A0AA88R7Y6_9ASTE|nr:hypothetical protein RJ640_021477 [Escallonia rubra]
MDFDKMWWWGGVVEGCERLSPLADVDGLVIVRLEEIGFWEMWGLGIVLTADKVSKIKFIDAAMSPPCARPQKDVLYHCKHGQITIVYKEKEHAEVEFTVGPIPIDDGVGKEIITQIKTTMKSNRTFYTDSNGRDFLEREVSWPRAGWLEMRGRFFSDGILYRLFGWSANYCGYYWDSQEC